MKTKLLSFLTNSILLAVIVALSSAFLPQARAVTITQPGDLIGGGAITSGTTFTIGNNSGTPNTNSWPGTEDPTKAIDGDTSFFNKYLNFFGANSGYIVTPAAGASVVTGLTLFTANDTPGRDPLTFSLYGSNAAVASTNPGDTFNLATFTAIVLNGSTNLAADPGRNAAPAVQPTFANLQSFTTYVLVFPTLRQSDISMQIGEAALTGTIGQGNGNGHGVPETGSTFALMLGSIAVLIGFGKRFAVRSAEAVRDNEDAT